MTHAARRRVAIVEIGTNSSKLLIADVLPHGGFVERHFSRKTTRIGRGMKSGVLISTDAVRRTVRVTEGFRRSIDHERCTHVFAFSTFALRTASNAGRVTRSLEKSLRCELRILTGREEARFAYLSAASSLGLHKPAAVLLDVGGGSTEVVHVAGRRVRSSSSLPLGALHLTERFLPSDPPARDEYAAMERFIRRTIARSCRSVTELEPSAFDMVASGGSVTTLAGMIARGKGPGNRIRLADAAAFLELCLSLPLSGRKRIPGLEPDRADIIIAGLGIVLSFMRAVRKRSLRTNPGGVREGVLEHVIVNGLQW